MSRLRLLLALASVAAIGCSDEPTSPKNPLASQLDALADSSTDDYRVRDALYAASAVLRAGGKIGSVEIMIDSQPYAFKAVATRLAYSPAACDQLKSMLYGMFEDDSVIYAFPADMCAPVQQLVAWEGDDMRRVAVVVGDTGTSSSSLSSLAGPFNFWGQMSDVAYDKEWWTIGGSQTSRTVSLGAACKSFSMPEAGADFACRLATLRQSFDLMLEEFDYYGYDDFDYDSTVVRSAIRKPSLDVRDSVVVDTVVFDSSYVWEPGPTHTMAMRPTSLDGLALTILRFDFPEGGMLMRKSAIQSARLKRTRATLVR
jgi:hypothetical protein